MTARLATKRTAGRDDAVSVLLPLAVPAPYDYLVPSGTPAPAGAFVEVPLGARRAAGVVWGAARGGVDPKKLKHVNRVSDLPPLPDATREFIDWVAAYTLSPPGSVLRMALAGGRPPAAPAPAAAWTPAPGNGSESGSPPGGMRMTESRRKVLAALAGSPPLTTAALARKAAVSPSVIRGLARVGALLPAEAGEADPVPDPSRAGPVLSEAQEEVARALVGRLGRGFSVALLDGVTGAGKTEVYFEAIAAALAAGRQAVVLLPEIALTTDWLARFEVRFGAPAAVWHSNLSASRRRRTWRAVLDGAAPLVVGARSALMLPYRNLGLIVVDEEHDSSFKQEDGVIYNARDMAVVRGRIGGFPVVLSSATPSLDTVDNVWRGRYERLSLPERFAGARLPEIVPVDLRGDPPGKANWLSPALSGAVDDVLAAGEQAMLFLNRRGYAPLTLCRTCGHRLGCPRCTAWLVEHRSAGRLRCHHCDYRARLPRACPSCGAEESFAACGPGVERLAEEAGTRFPKARLEIMSSDTVDGPEAARELVGRMTRGEIEVLIGTQIMAKGFHFPSLTLVGVVDADIGLSGGDLRAAERTYQLLHQVAGRAGRGERPGRAMLQTWQPEHPVIQALISGDRDRFMAAEAEQRRLYRMPPYGRLAAVIVWGEDEAAVDATADALGRAAPRGGGLEVLGPAPAPLAVIRNRHRRRLLVCGGRNARLQGTVRAWVSGVRPGRGVRVAVDMDPYSFM